MKEFWTVYVMRSESGSVLYVGRSVHPVSRISKHRKDKEWFREISSIELVHFGSFAEMAEAEIALIDDLRPVWNVTYIPDERPVFRSPDGPECISMQDIQNMLQGRNVKKVAEMCGVNRNLISQIKRGQKPNITLKTWRKLSDYLMPRSAPDHGVKQ